MKKWTTPITLKELTPDELQLVMQSLLEQLGFELFSEENKDSPKRDILLIQTKKAV